MSRSDWANRILSGAARACILAALISALCPAGAAAQELTVYEMSLQELYRAASYSIQTREYADAIPNLREIIARLPDPQLDSAIRMLEYGMYHVAVCHVEMNSLDDALLEFATYIKRFPKGTYHEQARILVAEIHAARESWDQVIKTTQWLLDFKNLRPSRRVLAAYLNGEAKFRLEQWNEAVKPLIYVFERGPDPDIRSEAAVMATISLLRLERISELFRFLPLVYQTSAQYDIELNIALIEGGDNRFGLGEFEEALLLYRPVYFKPELLRQLGARIKETTRKRELLYKSGMDLGEILSLRRKYSRLLASLERQRETAVAFPEYDQQLVMRLAETHRQLERNWEAMLQFHSIFDQWPDHELAEEALYLAFAAALDLVAEERALQEGYDYLSAFPAGEFYELVSLSVAQTHLAREEWRDCVDIGVEALDIVPEHEMRAQLDFLIGYSHFQLEELTQALDRFGEIRQEYPLSDVKEDADYWHPMTHLFLQENLPARIEFEEFLDRYVESSYLEDASYRLGIAQYGDDDFDAAEKTLQQFIQQYPESKLVAEAYCMLGDIYASWAKLGEAVQHYNIGIQKAENIVHVNYGTFQTARVFEIQGKFEEIIWLFKSYIDQYEAEGNVSQALYWIGNMQIRLGREQEGFETFLSGIEKYGNDPKNFGIDMIVRDLIEDKAKTSESADRRQFMSSLREKLSNSRATGNKTLELRLLTLFAESQRDAIQRTKMMAVLVNERNLQHAAPIALLTMGNEASSRKKQQVAEAAYSKLLNDYGESDLVLEASMGLARLYAVQGRAKDAVDLYRGVISRFPAEPQAGAAQKGIGDVLRAQKKYSEAILAYQTVLSVRDWRGPLWPESLYWIGDCHRQQGQYEEAFAHFQRIYVLYEHYLPWMAKGYIAGAECLEQLNQRQDAVRHYRELLARPELKNADEIKTATEALERLGEAS
jgi:TolA-binding protein